MKSISKKDLKKLLASLNIKIIKPKHTLENKSSVKYIQRWFKENQKAFDYRPEVRYDKRKKIIAIKFHGLPSEFRCYIDEFTLTFRFQFDFKGLLLHRLSNISFEDQFASLSLGRLIDLNIDLIRDSRGLFYNPNNLTESIENRKHRKKNDLIRIEMLEKFKEQFNKYAGTMNKVYFSERWAFLETENGRTLDDQSECGKIGEEHSVYSFVSAQKKQVECIYVPQYSYLTKEEIK